MLKDFFKSQEISKRERELRQLSIDSNLYPNEDILTILEEIIKEEQCDFSQVYISNNIDLYGSCVANIVGNHKIKTYYFYDSKLVTSKEYRESLYNI